MALVLDGVLLVLLVLFAIAGLRRGPWPEVVVLGGLLLGALLADEWGDVWGRDLGSTVGVLGTTGASILVRALLFLLPLILVGYAGGLLLPRTGRLGVRARLAGALLAAFNALAIFALLLRNWHYSQGVADTSLTADPGISFLLEWAGWWPVALAVGGILAVLIGVLTRGRRALPVAVSLPPVSDPGFSGGPVGLPAGNGGRFDVPAGTRAIPLPAPVPATRPVDLPAEHPVPAGTGTAVTAPAHPDERRCRTCGTVLAPGAAFCPNCGTPV